MKLKIILVLPILFALAGCGHKKIVVKDCEQAANSGVWVCDKL